MPCPVGFDPIVRGVQGKTGAAGYAGHIREIPHNVCCLGKCLADLGCNQRITSRSQPNDKHLTGHGLRP